VRADRLVAVLLLLQARGHVTAAEVATELEVSERTARRDLEALGMAGVPVYSRPGRGGGWQLVGGARTDLTGLTAAEARALFLVAGPSSSATPQVKTALRKLVRALPEPFRADAEAAATAVVVDPTSWGRPVRSRATPRFLDDLQRAVVEGEQVVLGYVAREGAASTRLVHPLGLATKGTAWYLVADTAAGFRTFRVDRVAAVEPTGDAVVRPEDFDLEAAWRLITETVDQRWATFTAHATATPDIVPVLRMVLGNQVRIGPAGVTGRVEVEIGASDVRVLAGVIAGFGDALIVRDPPELLEHLARIGAELTQVYARVSTPRPLDLANGVAAPEPAADDDPGVGAAEP
jgi:predicted DNA-binding transcriptional regulator YafY